MVCLTYTLECGIGAVGGECNWTIECCGGTKTSLTLLAGQTADVCLDITKPEFLRRNSTSGDANTAEVSCSTNCGSVDPAPVPPVPTSPVPPNPPSPPTPPDAPTPDYCLTAENTVAAETLSGTNKYVFNGNYGLYGTNVGTYVIEDVPANHPIAFQNYGVTSEITYTGTTAVGPKAGLDGNTYTYYYGDVTLTVSGDYGTISYECFYQGYMGGENNLVYNADVCSLPVPTPTPPVTPTPTPPSVVPPIPSPVTTEYTLTYSETVKGWPSFYSYVPDYMVGMNNYLYSFSKGNLYKHNTNSLRNNYYDVQYNSQITSVFNTKPLENKIFKTLNLEADSAWTANLETDIQARGYIDSTWFEKKEGAYFAYLRKTGTIPAAATEYALRSANGIGKAASWGQTGNVLTLNFSTNPVVDMGNIVSIGDYLYFSEPAYTTISLSGQITNIEVNLQSGINRIFVNTNISGSVIIGVPDPYILYIKDMEAETHGMLGHQMTFSLINNSTIATELFAVESEVLKSYP